LAESRIIARSRAGNDERDRAEVVFAVGIVVVGEGVERANLLQERATLIDRRGLGRAR
jgi:hypothetical protein